MLGEDADERRYCFCNNVSYGDMIGCDDDDCEREWFHLGCVGLLKPPQGTWYCDDCATKRAVSAGPEGRNVWQCFETDILLSSLCSHAIPSRRRPSWPRPAGHTAVGWWRPRLVWSQATSDDRFALRWMIIPLHGINASRQNPRWSPFLTLLYCLSDK